MKPEVTAVPGPAWEPLPYEGCSGVEGKVLLTRDELRIAMLRFGAQATMHEHSTAFDVDVICLEGSGTTSVGGEETAISAGELARWPAGDLHLLWTEGSEMVTLMVEYRG